MKEFITTRKEPLSEEKKELGVTDRLPSSLAKAIEAMEEDGEFLRDVLGKKCFDSYVTHRKGEIKFAEGMMREARVREARVRVE